MIFLDRVSRELGVPEDQAGRRVQPRDQPAGEDGEGVMIASHRSLDELSLVHGSHLRYRRGMGSSRLGWYVAGELKVKVGFLARRNRGLAERGRR